MRWVYFDNPGESLSNANERFLWIKPLVHEFGHDQKQLKWSVFTTGIEYSGKWNISEEFKLQKCAYSVI